MARRAAILSVLDEVLDPRDFHVVAPGALETRDRIGIWRDFVSAERQTEAYEEIGTEKAERPQDDFPVSSSLSMQKSTRPPTAGRECRPTQSERQRSSHLLHSLELAYASHVPENAKSPAMELLSW
ncbi:hypothetical protein BKA70DRAFT_1424093 [Coprinopsis sp. MPI-PUGE-AT-0042]|nr:hypothetical protein BKA70DRAFT_1424093 [Coprinopsis sp. MPI-PUGE-AT-0042]